ncbi:hypothetical protein ACLEPN_39015 [Myxococcus sp. 1LA]
MLEEHLDEAEFRWLQWETALGAPDFSRVETARLEERLLAHLDGLVVGAATGAESVLRSVFEIEDAFRISAAAYALLVLGEVDEVLLRLREAAPGARAAIRRGPRSKLWTDDSSVPPFRQHSQPSCMPWLTRS